MFAHAAVAAVTESRIGGWLQTATGGQFWPMDPRPEEVQLDDIAHALSHLCRFAGHCREFYSVAQHSVLVSQYVPRAHAFQALLHDAAEAYLVDLPRPLKLELPDYRNLEKRVQAAIYQRFHLPAEEPPCIKAADDRVLGQEHRDLMAVTPFDWSRLDRLEPLPVRVQPQSPRRAYGGFLLRFASLAPKEVLAEWL